MATKIIVSYDGTENDTDALALGQLLARAGGSLALAYVRHAAEPEAGREQRAQKRGGGAARERRPLARRPRRAAASSCSAPSTPEGLRDLAEREERGADRLRLRVPHDAGARRSAAPRRSCCSRAARSRVAIAPGRACSDRPRRDDRRRSPPSSENGDPAAAARRRPRSRRGSARRSSRGPTDEAGLVVIGSKPGTASGRVTLSAAAAVPDRAAPLPRARAPARIGAPLQGRRLGSGRYVFRSGPRISPAGFLAVWTFTYVPPPRTAFTCAAVSVALPFAPELQGPQSGTATGPALPGRPRWMCAAVAGPAQLAERRGSTSASCR